MLRNLTELGIAFVELVEAEARSLASGTKRTAAMAAGMVIVAMVAGSMLVIGTGLLIWSLYTVLDEYFTTAGALALTGAAVWLVFGGGAWLAISAMRRKT